MEDRIRGYKEEICSLSEEKQQELGNICSYIFQTQSLA